MWLCTSTLDHGCRPQIISSQTELVAATFVRCAPETTIDLSRGSRLLKHAEIVVVVLRELAGYNLGIDLSSPRLRQRFDVDHLHSIIMSLATIYVDDVGVSSVSSSLYCATLASPVLYDPPCLEYRLEDGQFHDGRNYYQSLRDSETSSSWPEFGSGIALPGSRIISSSLGVHSHLRITTCPDQHHSLRLRKVVQTNGKEVQVHFRDLHLGHMGLTISHSCKYNPRTAIDEVHNRSVVATSVHAPIGSANRIAITLTHGNPEAQFLCCVPKARILFQSNCCLNCAFNDAIEGNFTMIIQS